ncbi:hypothetical protein ACIBL3_12585 [Kribbella sp. NPDC050124]|uniref:hypothetical protein n=1 Tax=Kribbella sp. NPDC050124 TaxID=3364114 RepID=UPI00379406D0
MTTSTLIDDPVVQAPMSADALLFGSATGAVKALSDAINERGTTRTAMLSVRRMSSPAIAVVDREIGSITGGLLNLDLGDVLLSAWRKYAKLTDAARRTLAISGSEEIVPLAQHTVRSTYSPHVDLIANGLLIHSFKFELEIVFELTALQAVVRAGTLTALAGGKCVVTATLSLDGAQLARKSRPVDLELMVRLQPPRPLITSSVTA